MLLKRKNGKVKEYDFGLLIFEGEYLNGKKHGKAKEYYLEYLEFEGEYKNGKRWNEKGEEIDHDERRLLVKKSEESV